MTRTIPLPLQQVRDHLRQVYTGLITGTGNNPDINFLSKALAAFAIKQLAHCTVEESAQAIVDGGNDGGIDAVFVKDDVLWLVQSKFIQDGAGQPDLGDVTKFKEGVDNILHGRYEIVQANTAFQEVIPHIERCLESDSASVRACLVYSGNAVLERDRVHLFDGLERRLNTPGAPDLLKFQTYNLTSLRDFLLENSAVYQVDATLTLHNPAFSDTTDELPHQIWYGLIRLQDLADLYDEHGENLIADNIRGFKGQTEVNEQIASTLRNQPELFLYLNNGLTAYCQRVGVPAIDRGRTDVKRLNVTDLSIVNGAQTLGVIAEANFALRMVGNRNRVSVDQIENEQTIENNEGLNGYVFMRLISTERADDERALGRSITFSTNFQNQVHWRDFASLDTNQATIADHLQLSGIYYHYRDADNTPDPDEENFDFQEAMLALACLESDSQCDLCSKALSHRQALASPKEVYSDTEVYRSRYARLFRSDRPAEEVWRAVQVLRAVKARMTENVRASEGARKIFFRSAKYLVAHILFIRFEPHKSASLNIEAQQVQEIRDATDLIAETLWGIYDGDATFNTRSPTGVFSQAADCRYLKGRVFQGLSRR